jgi:hypothetical protein
MKILELILAAAIGTAAWAAEDITPAADGSRELVLPDTSVVEKFDKSHKGARVSHICTTKDGRVLKPEDPWYDTCMANATSSRERDLNQGSPDLYKGTRGTEIPGTNSKTNTGNSVNKEGAGIQFKMGD